MPKTKLRRGDPHPTDPNKIFYQYNAKLPGGIRWSTRESWDKKKAWDKAYSKANSAKRSLQSKEHYVANTEKLKARSAHRYATNKESISEQTKGYRARNREKIKASKREYYLKNRERIALKAKADYEANRGPALARAHAHKHNPENKKRRNALEKIRKREDPLHNLRCGVRIRMCSILRKKGYGKASKSAEILGCSWEEFKNHIEKGFKEGMSWENRSEWHVDHIIPLASANSEEALVELFHYTNTQPLWRMENLRKSAKMPLRHNM